VLRLNLLQLAELLRNIAIRSNRTRINVLVVVSTNSELQHAKKWCNAHELWEMDDEDEWSADVDDPPF
jgi:hypothetical protein